MWTKIQINRTLGLEAQHVLRWENAPVCCIKRRDDAWHCSLLNRSGISTVPLRVPLDKTVEQVQQLCEEVLATMGWKGPRHKETSK